MRQSLFPFAFALAIAVTGGLAPARGAQATGPQAVLELRDIGPAAGAGVAFVDALQQASPWSSTTADALELDSRGNVLSLKPGQAAQRIVYAGATYPSGDYTLLYEGKGTFATGGASLEAAGPGRATVRVGAASASGLSLTLTATDPSDPVRDVRLILPGYDPSGAVPPFTPSFVSSLRGWNVLRFDNWMHADTFVAPAYWPERPRVARATQAMPNGVAPEYMIALANASAEDPWFTLPVGASNAYVYGFADLVHRTLDPRLHPIFQYGNEVWKPGTGGYAYALMAAHNTGLAGTGQTAALAWYAQRSARVFALVRQAFGKDASRALCVVSGPASQVLAVVGRSADGFALAAGTPQQVASLTSRIAGSYSLPLYPYATAPSQAATNATTRYAAPGTAPLVLGSDPAPQREARSGAIVHLRQPVGTSPTGLHAGTTLDLAGKAGLSGALGVPLDRPDLEDEGSADWVSLPAAAASQRKSTAQRLIAISPPDATGAIHLTAPADTTERILRVYVSVNKSRSIFTATLDGATYTDSSFMNPRGARSGVYTLVYRALGPGEQVRVTFAPATRGLAPVQVTAATLGGRNIPTLNTNPPDQAQYHNDLLRTGWNNFEPYLNTTNVASSSFALLQTLSVDSNVLAQPLYLAHVALAGGGTHNVLIVATENDSVYEFDADTGAQLNHVSLGTAQSAVDIGCHDISPVFGITSTPVVDRTTGTLYVVAATEPTSGNFVTSIHALDITSLADKVTPTVITATSTLTNGTTISYNQQHNFNRTGLAFANNSIYIGVGSHCDNDASQISGWLLRYDTSLHQLAAFSTIDDPTTQDNLALASIWQTGFAPSFDSAGNVYVVTGNGAFDIPSGGKNYGESVLKLNPNLSQVLSYFTPSNFAYLNSIDGDFSSGGVMLLPAQPGIKTRVAVAEGKASIIYVLDTSALGGYSTSDAGAVQVLPAFGGGLWGGPAFFSGPTGQFVYFQTGSSVLQAYKVNGNIGTTFKPSLTLSSSGTSHAGYGGSLPVVTSYLQQPGTGIVWLVDRGAGTLYLEAYNALDVSDLLFRGAATSWSNSQNNGFVTPLVANGKVYVTGTNAVAVFGLH